MAQGAVTDVGPSTEMVVTEPQDFIPDDIFEAALIASQQDDMGENPYEPQPKRYMQTEQQKIQQERDLEIKKIAWTLRKMRIIQEARHKQMKKQKQRPSPFEKLPSELGLKLMQHTHWQDLRDFIDSDKFIRRIFEVNEKAVFRGIEIEQFPEWKWLFGNSKKRTSAQRQYLKDAMFSEVFVRNPRRQGWAYDEQLPEVLQIIDDNDFTSMWNIRFLQDMQDLLDVDMILIESYAKTNIARRTAICLRSLSSRRPNVLEEENRYESGPLVGCLLLSWEERSQLINDQPASIQAEIRFILRFLIQDLYSRVECVIMEWTWRHYTSRGNQLKAYEMKKWLSSVVTGHMLEEVILKWYAVREDSSSAWYFDWEETFFYLADELEQLLERHDQGKTDAIQELRGGLEFGRSIGLDVGALVDGTLAGGYVDVLLTPSV